MSSRIFLIPSGSLRNMETNLSHHGWLCMVTLSPEVVLPNDILAPHQGQGADAFISMSSVVTTIFSVSWVT